MSAPESALPYRMLSTHEAADFVQRVEACQDALYGSSSFSEAEGQVARHLREIELEAARAAAQGGDSVSQWEKILEEMKTTVMGWPLLEVELAWRPNADFVRKLGTWLEQAGMAPARVAITHAPDILGGLVVGYEGQRYDLSLARDLENLDERLPTIGS